MSPASCSDIAWLVHASANCPLISCTTFKTKCGRGSREPVGSGWRAQTSASSAARSHAPLNSAASQVVWYWLMEEELSGQRVLDVRRGGLHMHAERGIPLGQFLLHQPGDSPVGPMALHPGAELRDILRFGKIHLEQAAHFEAERDGIERRLPADFL